MTILTPIRSSLLEETGITHGFFTRQGGVSQGLYASLNGGLGSADQLPHVTENRARMARTLSIEPTQLLSLYQIHSQDVVTVTTPWPISERPKADGMVTNIEGIALAIGTADCGPVLFIDPRARVVGACHAGWKGAIGGVIEATIAAMEQLGAEREYIRASLGPTISQSAYEVGQDFIAQFEARDKDGLAYFRSGQSADKKQFNLPAYIGHRIKRAGIEAFDDLGLCTYADEERFFSFRRTTHRNEKDYGRLISAIALIP